MNRVTIEALEGDDLDDCASLYAEVFNEPPWNENWKAEQAFERLALYHGTPRFLGVCVRHSKELTGFALGNCEPYQSESVFVLKEMCVASDRRGQGIGTLLLQHLHKSLEESGVSIVNLLTRSGSTAEKFYLANGYTKSDRMRLYVAKLRT